MPEKQPGYQRGCGLCALNESSECVPEREERRWTQTDRQRYREKEDAEGRELGFHTQADKWLRTEA